LESQQLHKKIRGGGENLESQGELLPKVPQGLMIDMVSISDAPSSGGSKKKAASIGGGEPNTAALSPLCQFYSENMKLYL